MTAARIRPKDGGKTVPIKIYQSTLDLLKPMSFYSKEILKEKNVVFMNGIIHRAVEEYYDNHFKNKIPKIK